MKTLVLSILAFTAFILFIAEPSDEATFFQSLILSKLGAIALIYIAILLYQHWNKDGKINKLNKFLEDD